MVRGDIVGIIAWMDPDTKPDKFGKGTEQIDVYLYVGTYNQKVPHSFFVTTAALRRAIAHSRIQSLVSAGQTSWPIGRMHYEVSHSKQLIRSIFIDPFLSISRDNVNILSRVLTGKPPDVDPTEENRFKRKGIANLLEYQIERRLAARFPAYKVISSVFPTDPRISQLRKRGREYNVEMDVHRAAALTKGQVLKDFQKSKKRTIALTQRETRRRLAK